MKNAGGGKSAHDGETDIFGHPLQTWTTGLIFGSFGRFA
jgi:hypothetical protein